jgi:hypothetical protein
MDTQDELALLVTPVGGEAALEFRGSPVGLGAAGDHAWTFDQGSGPPGTADLALRPILVDACASAGSTFLFGAIGENAPPSFSIVVPGAPAPIPFEVSTLPPGATSGGFLFPNEPACDVLHPLRDSKLPPIKGTATYNGIGRGCADFSSDVTFTESKKNRGIDTYTMRGTQGNRGVNRNPFVAVDTSTSFDEIHLFTIPDPNDPEAILGAAIGGGPGTLPQGKKLDKAVEFLFADQSQDLVEELLAQVQANKPPKQLVKGVKAKKNACTYGINVDLEKRPDAASFESLVDAFAPEPQPLALDDRFRVDLEPSDGTTIELAASPLFGQPGAVPDDGTFWFFEPGNWEMLVKVIDGCSFNQHFWVFAAGLTDVEHTLAVTDTTNGESRTYDAMSTSIEPVMDTSAFATCP